MTHALVDGQREFLTDATGPDAAAFHEAELLARSALTILAHGENWLVIVTNSADQEVFTISADRVVAFNSPQHL